MSYLVSVDRLDLGEEMFDPGRRDLNQASGCRNVECSCRGHDRENHI